MHNHLFAIRLGRWAAAIVLGALAAPAAHAQLGGTKAIPGDYATVAAAIADLNTQGVGASGVTFNIAAGYTETFASPTAGALTATGTAAGPIVFQKAGTGANPRLTAGTGTSTTLDAIISLAGSDYVTFDGLELAENTANTTATTQAEFGFALFRSTPTNGCQYNVIRNCVVTLNKANTGTFGIYGAASTAAAATAVAATSPAGANSYNRIYGNTVSNAVSGLYLTASSSTTAANFDLNNEIGMTAGNTVTNFGGVATSGWGIGVNMQGGAKIANNTVNSAGGTAGTSTLRGIYANSGTSASIDITGNTITLAGGATTSSVIGIDNGIGSTAAGNTVNITGNTIQSSTYPTATSGAFYAIQNTASAATVNLNNNTITGNASAATSGSFMALRNTAAAATLNVTNNTVTNNTLTGTGEYDVVYNSGTISTALTVNGNQFSSTAAIATTGALNFLLSDVSNAGTMSVQNNTFGNFTKSGAGGTVYGYYNNSSPTATQTIAGNTLSGITLTGATTFYGTFINTSTTQVQTITNNTVSNVTGGTNSVYGLYVGYGAATSTISGNVVSGLSSAGSTYGLYLGSSLGGGNVFANTISNLTTTGTATVYGLFTAATTPTIYRNKLYNLAGSAAGSLVYGLYVSGGTTATLHNNLVGDLRAPAATGLNAVVGLYVNGGTTVNAYYNTINLAASSTGATFGSSGIHLNSTSTTLDARNNVVVNKSTAAGTGGFTAALRRVSGTAATAPANLASTANNNLYYAGTPSATNVIYVEGTTTATNASQTLAAYKALVAPRENSSQTEDVPFLSTTGTDATFLHVSPTVPTLVEGKALPISSITTDFDNDNRSSTTPDIGADEGTFVSAGAGLDVAATGLVAPSTTGCYGAAESVVVSIRNNGTQALNFAATPVTVTVAVTGAATQNLTATVNTGTLAPGASQNVTVGTLNMSAAGTYNFAIAATVTGDGDTSNDNTSATHTKVALASGPQQLDFTGFTGSNLSTLYPGWYEATGATLPTGTTSTWTSDDYANVVNGPNGISAKINLYSNTRNDWMVSPRVLATASSVLTYDLALTAYSTTTAGTLGSDDRLEVRVSTDCGLTFSTIKSYTAASVISATGQSESVSLASYAGQEIIVAFFGTEGTVDDPNDNDVFIDNINLNPQAVDLLPTALVAPVTGQGCYGTAENVVVSIRNNGSQALNFATNPATVTAAVTGATTQTLTATVSTGTLAPSASQNVTLAPGLNMSTAGTYSFAITATVTGDQNTANDALASAVTRTVTAPVAGTASASATSLCVSGTATLTLTGSANGSIQWQQSTDNVTFTDISGATAATYTTAVLNSTTYFRARTSCNTTVATSNVLTITITNPQVTGTNSPVAICEGGTATLTATAATGTTVRFFETATGGTALAATGGTFTTPALTASRQYFAEAAVLTTAVAGLPSNATTYGTFSQSSSTDYPLGFAVTQAGTLASVGVYPTAAGALTIRLYSVSGAQPGGTATAVANSDVTVTVTAAQVGTLLTVPLNYTLAPGEYKLSNFVGGLGRFSTYSGTYPLASADGTLIVRGSYTFTSSTSYSNTTYNSFFNLTFNSQCVAATRTAIQVNVTPAATAAFPAATASSCGASPYQLAGTVGGSATAGTYTSSGTGTFAPNASTLNATYTPSAADVAAGTVTLTLTSTAVGSCPTATATLALALSPAPVATFSYPTATTYCAGAASTVTPTLGSGASAGTFSSTTGLTLDPTTGVITLSSSVAGTYTVTNTIAASGACPAVTATQTVTILPVAVATFGYGATTTFCVSGTTNPTVVLGSGASAGTFSSTTGLSLNATTGAITLSSSTPGTYTVTNTVAGSGTACGSTATTTVTITAAPLAAFSYAPASACVGSGTATPTLGTGATAGTFSSTTGLTISATTGVITLASSTPGTYTVTNTLAAGSGCAAATSTTTFTVSPAAVANAGASQTICAGGSATLGTAAVAGTTYAWSPATGLSSATAAQPTVTLPNMTGAALTATYTLTATTGAGCVATSTVTVTVNPAPATPTVTVTYPTRSTALLTSSPAPAGTTYQWYLGTTAITGATSQTYTANGTAAPGTYTVRFIAATGCQSAASTTVTVTATAQPQAGATLTLFPNPTTDGKLTVQLSGYAKAVQLTVLDALGRVVLSQRVAASQPQAQLDLSAAAQGVYLLRATTEGGTTDLRRIVRE